MPTLHVRDIPDALYDQLRQLAKAQNRSLSAEVIMLLTDALEREQRRGAQRDVLRDAARLRTRLAGNGDRPDSTELLREDRRR